MAKITLPELSGGFQSVALANANNDAIESALNNEVLYRNLNSNYEREASMNGCLFLAGLYP